MQSAANSFRRAFARPPVGIPPGPPVAVDMTRRAHYDRARWSDRPGHPGGRVLSRNIQAGPAPGEPGRSADRRSLLPIPAIRPVLHPRPRSIPGITL
jgi:hypothetical protein